MPPGNSEEIVWGAPLVLLGTPVAALTSQNRVFVVTTVSAVPTFFTFALTGKLLPGRALSGGSVTLFTLRSAGDSGSASTVTVPGAIAQLLRSLLSTTSFP